MPNQTVDVLFRIRAAGQEQLNQIAAAIKGAKVDVKSGTEAVQGYSAAHDQMGVAVGRAGESMTSSFIKASLLTEGILKGASALKEFTIGSAQYAARTQTLGVVMDQLAKVNNLSVGATRSQAQEVAKLGITTQESVQTVNKMIFAQLDLKRATDLARMSQNAAVIAGVNSSEALAGIINGIVTRQPEVLRTYGIIVDFEKAFMNAARERGHELSAVEKQEIALQAVLQQGAKITGAYEAAMLTAGKQLTSLPRYIDEAKNAIGEGLVPALSSAVMWMTKLSKAAAENPETFSAMASGVTALGIAMAAFKYMPGPPVVKGVAAAVAGGAAWLGLNQDPVKGIEQGGRDAVVSLQRQRAEINRKIAANPPTEELKTLRAQFDSIAEAERTLVNVAADELAKIYLAQEKGAKDNNAKLYNLSRGIQVGGLSLGDQRKPMPTLDFGSGVKVTDMDMFKAAQLRVTGDPGGATFNQAGYDAQMKSDIELRNRTKYLADLAKAEKAVADLIYEGATADLNAFEKLNAERAKTLKLYGMNPTLRRDINLSFNQQLDAEIKKAVPPGFGPTKTPDVVEQEVLRQTWQPSMMGDVVGANVKQGRASELVAWGKQLDEDAAKATQHQLAAMQQTLSFQEKLTQLLSGPGGEGAAIEKVRALRVSAAMEEFQITKDMDLFKSQSISAERDRIISILELQKRELENLKQSAGQLFDAMISKGGGGLKDFVLGQLQVIERQVFMNLAGEIGGGLKGKLTLPGTTDAQGKPTTLGRILQGTPFGPDSSAGLKLSTDRNSTATELNSTAIQQMTVALKSAGGGGGAGTGFGALDKMLAYGSDITGLSINDLPVLSDKQRATLMSTMPGAPTGWDGAAASPVNSNAGLYKALGYDGAIAAGGFGVYSGVKQGGAQGALTAGASVAATVGAVLPMISASLAMAGPIGMIAGMGLALVSSLLGDPKKKRQETLDKELAAAAFTAPTATNRTEDLSGNALDYDMRGGLRSTNVTYRTEVKIQAFDNKSVMDHGPEIAESVRRQVRDGHPLRLEMQAAQV